jgi:hypothetical protein
MEGYARLRELASSLEHIIPGHDPAVMHLYPPLNAELKGIAACLHQAPTQ